MTAAAEMRPQVTGTAELRRAASDCCAALLNRAAGGGIFCGQCGRPCDLVYGAPEEVTFHG